MQPSARCDGDGLNVCHDAGGMSQNEAVLFFVAAHGFVECPVLVVDWDDQVVNSAECVAKEWRKAWLVTHLANPPCACLAILLPALEPLVADVF